MDALFYKDTMYGGGGAMRGNYFNPIIYSTEERVVGVGENNKPLYQKTVTSNTLAAETGETVLTGIDSLKVLSSRTNTTYPFYISTYNVGGSGTEYGMVRLDTNGDVLLYNASRSASVVIEAVLQYTKTSDVAGSGSYNTLGVPNVHYTTEEQVIGTWMGETLYKKTINVNFSTNDLVNNILYYTTIDISNLISNMAKGWIDSDMSYYIADNIQASFIYTNITNSVVELWTHYRRNGVATLTIQYTKTS